MAKKRYDITATCYDKRGRIISSGKNSYVRTHPIQAMFARIAGLPHKQVLHAEIAALLKARHQEVHTIMIERYDAIGNPVDAEPCPICKLAIKHWKVKHVQFTTPKGINKWQNFHI